MAAAVDNPNAKVYRDSFPFDRYVPHASFAAHVADLEEYVRGIGWVVEIDDFKLTFELRMDTEWELRDLAAEMENELRSRGIEWSPSKECMDESNILRLEYRMPEERGPGHATATAEVLWKALEKWGVEKERLSWRVP